jgi:DNA replication protein DnaC
MHPTLADRIHARKNGVRAADTNLVFSDWIRIFKDPMTTAAAIDRLIHHAVILEMTGVSFRNEAARKRGDATPATTTTTTDQTTTTTT